MRFSKSAIAVFSARFVLVLPEISFADLIPAADSEPSFNRLTIFSDSRTLKLDSIIRRAANVAEIHPLPLIKLLHVPQKVTAYLKTPESHYSIKVIVVHLQLSPFLSPNLSAAAS